MLLASEDAERVFGVVLFAIYSVPLAVGMVVCIALTRKGREADAVVLFLGLVAPLFTLFFAPAIFFGGVPWVLWSLSVMGLIYALFASNRKAARAKEQDELRVAQERIAAKEWRLARLEQQLGASHSDSGSAKTDAARPNDADRPSSQATTTEKAQRGQPASSIRIECRACKKRMSGSKGKVVTLKKCPKCGAAPFDYRMLPPDTA